jgi:hypothetical protein
MYFDTLDRFGIQFDCKYSTTYIYTFIPNMILSRIILINNLCYRGRGKQVAWRGRLKCSKQAELV